MHGPAFRRGDRVSLHPIEVEDLDFLSREDEQAWIEQVRDSDDGMLLVCSDDERVGALGFKDLDTTDGTAELAYWIAPDHQRKGYATAAVELLVDYGFRERRLDKISAETYAYNEESWRVLETFGFDREGVLRDEAFVDGERVDVYRYGLLADEWDGA